MTRLDLSAGGRGSRSLRRASGWLEPNVRLRTLLRHVFRFGNETSSMSRLDLLQDRLDRRVSGIDLALRRAIVHDEPEDALEFRDDFGLDSAQLGQLAQQHSLSFKRELLEDTRGDHGGQKPQHDHSHAFPLANHPFRHDGRMPRLDKGERAFVTLGFWLGVVFPRGTARGRVDNAIGPGERRFDMPGVLVD